jgi:hypothetical protein
MTALIMLLAACGSEPIDTADSDPTTTDRQTGPSGCDEVEVGYDGPNPPTVGDTWIVWPICDGAVVLGATVIRVDPSTCASLFENELTWLEAGTCTVMAQTGSQRAYLEVEISPAG